MKKKMEQGIFEVVSNALYIISLLVIFSFITNMYLRLRTQNTWAKKGAASILPNE